MDDSQPAALQQKEAAFTTSETAPEYCHAKLLADLWCAAFVIKKTYPASDEAESPISNTSSQIAQPIEGHLLHTDDDLFGQSTPTPAPAKAAKQPRTKNQEQGTARGITTAHLRDFVQGKPLPTDLQTEVEALARQYRFFHWHLAFPQVFDQGGFACILGNPPWEVVAAEEQEFFSSRAPEIVAIATRSKRLAAIQDLERSHPGLFIEWEEERRRSLVEAHFSHASNLYPLTGQGNLNSYLLFTERGRQLIGKLGRVGLILPSAAASSETSKELFQDLIDSSTLVCLFDFENREQLFPAVHSSMKFCLLTAAGTGSPDNTALLAFNLRNVSELNETGRQFAMTAQDFRLLNPNTRTAATFTSRQDADLVLYLHKRHSVLRDDSQPLSDRAWHVECMRMVDLSYESAHFVSEEDLKSRGFAKILDHYTDRNETFYPVFEAKMTQQYDHRAADVVISATAQIRSAQPESLNLEDHQDPNRFSQPRFWMPSTLAFRAVPEWYAKEYYLTYTLVTSPTNQRTMLASIIPKRPAGHSLRLIYPKAQERNEEPFLLAALNSFSFDFVCRNKIGGVNLNPVIAYQMPVPRPSAALDAFNSLGEPIAAWIASRVLELTYTAWDLEAFAADCGWSGPPFRWDEERRFLLRCELDAAFFHLYLGPQSEWQQQPEALTRAFPTPRHAVSVQIAAGDKSIAAFHCADGADERTATLDPDANAFSSLGSSHINQVLKDLLGRLAAPLRRARRGG
jgi:hypothetical protein